MTKKPKGHKKSCRCPFCKRARGGKVRKGGKNMGKKRSYGNRAMKYVRSHKFVLPSIATGVLLLAAAKRFGWIDAGMQAWRWDWSGAFNTLIKNASVQNLLPIAAGAVGIVVAHKVVGSVPLYKSGRFSLRVI